MARTPVAVEVWRNGRVESRHRVRVSVTDAGGRAALAVGDITEPVVPRSAVEPFLAPTLVESGAADTFGVSEAELALASASHGGEVQHVALVAAWLDRLQPLDDAARAALAPPIRPCPVNHAGMQVGHIAMAPGWPAP